MRSYRLELTAAEMRVIDQALQELPYRLAAPLIANINRQIEEGAAHETAADQH